MKSNTPIPRQRITRQYLLAVGCYLAPAVFFVVSLIDSATFDLTDNLFFGVAILSLLTCGCVGLFFSARGMGMAFKNKDYPKKDVGYANLLMGLIVATAGVLAMGFIYLI